MSAPTSWVAIAKRDRAIEADAELAGRTEQARQYRAHGDVAERMAKELADSMDLSMPSFAQLYAFVRSEYLDSRFEMRNAEWPNGVENGRTYAEAIVHSYMNDLERSGMGTISRFESCRGRAVYFNRELRVLGGVL